jgi:hypothetical protein
MRLEGLWSRPLWRTIINNLGVLYFNARRFADAETALKEAACIDRELAAQNPAAYRADLVGPLNNLGLLYLNARRFAEAEGPFNCRHPARAGGAEPSRLPARTGIDAQQPGSSLLQRAALR